MVCKLAVIGDSLSQGFQDGAIGQGFGLRSFPALLARTLGLNVGVGEGHDFRVPLIPGDGLPLDIVELLRRVAVRTGPDINLLEWPTKVIPEVASYFEELETFYEVGPGSHPPGFSGVYHNLASFGLTVFESANLTSAICDELIREAEGWFRDDLFGTPSGAKYRAAKMVIDPDGGRPHATQLDNLDYLFNGNAALGIAAEPPDVLIIWLGANDCLGTVVSLELDNMPTGARDDVRSRKQYNLTAAEKFHADYRALADRVDAICGARQVPVFVGTVPDVTIPPIAQGLGELRDGVYDYYVRFFVDGKRDRPPLFHKHLTREQVTQIQRRIGEFNRALRAVVEPRPNWHVVDIADVLQRLAVRRNRKRPEEPLRDYYASLGKPEHPLLAPNLGPTPSLLTLRSDEFGHREEGGLTSLDGVHPSTVGYGIAAEVFLAAMQQQGVPGADPDKLDWTAVIAADRAVKRASAVWDDFLEAARSQSLIWDTLFRTLSSRL